MSPVYCWHFIRKSEPSHSAPGTIAQSAAPGADTDRGSGLTLPYWSQYALSTLSVKKHDVGRRASSGVGPEPVAGRQREALVA